MNKDKSKDNAKMTSRLSRIICVSSLILAASCGDSEDVINVGDGAAGDDSNAGAGGDNSNAGAGGDDSNAGSGGDDSNAGSGGDASNAGAGGQGETEVVVTGPITADTEWKEGTLYKLDGIVFVENDAVLSIEAGTRIVGGAGSALVITQGSQIDAEGTKDEPIVFSSAQPAGDRASNDWGGVVLLGSAPNHIEAPEIEGIDPAEDADRISYGGSEADSSCGTLRYVRIEFAGFEFAGDNELNGLSVGSCGSGTVLDYIQVHLGSDDGIEMFGGTADLKHIVITGAEDDSLDWDQGWQGRGQFIVIQHLNAGSDAGFESDNNELNEDLTPRSMPILANLTLVGGAGSRSPGMVLRRGTHAQIYNAIVTGFPGGAIDVRDAGSVAGTVAGTLFVDNSIFFDNGSENFPEETGDADNDDGFDEADFFGDDVRSNRTVDPQLADVASRTAPNFMPADDSPAASGAAVPPDAEGFFDTSATFVGAIEPGGTDWTEGWTDYPRN